MSPRNVLKVTLEKNKIETTKRRMENKKSIVIIEPVDINESTKTTESDDYRRDGDYDSIDKLFENLSDDDHDSVFNSIAIYSNKERSIGATRAKKIGKKPISPRKLKGAQLKSSMSNMARMKKRVTTVLKKDQVPTPRLQRPLELLIHLPKRLIPQQRPLHLLEKAKGCPKKQGYKS